MNRALVSCILVLGLIGCNSTDKELNEIIEEEISDSIMYKSYADYKDYGNSYLLRIEDTITSNFGYVNLQGDTIIPIEYFVAYTDTMWNYTIVLDSDRGLVAINREEEVLYEIFGYDNGPDYLVEGLFRIERNGLIGYANEKGEIIIEPKYQCANPFDNGIAEVAFIGDKEYDQGGEHWSWVSDEWYYIDREGIQTYQAPEGIIQDFFTVADSFFTERNWYYEDKSGVETLLLEGFQEKDYGWHYDSLSSGDNYLGISTFLSNTHIYVALRVFFIGEKNYAFLYESTKNTHELFLLQFDEVNELWLNKNELLPVVNNVDFFKGLDEEESLLVKEEGAFGIGLSPDKVMYYFDLTRLQDNISDYDVEFSKTHDYEFELKWNETRFWVKRHEKSFDTIIETSY